MGFKTTGSNIKKIKPDNHTKKYIFFHTSITY